MSEIDVSVVHGVLVETQLEFTLDDLSRVCRVERVHLLALIEEGVLAPRGRGPDDWRFDGGSLTRARAAVRLTRDLALNAAGTALVLDLLEDIESLKARLRHLGETT